MKNASSKALRKKILFGRHLSCLKQKLKKKWTKSCEELKLSDRQAKIY